MNEIKNYPPIETDWNYDAVAKRRGKFLSPSLGTFVAFEKPIVLKRGEMQYVWDETGKKYLDCLAQNLCVSVGHCHPLVNAEARKQADAMVHCTTMYYQAVPAHHAEELAATMPRGEDWVVHFVSSGSEAVDLAVLMARLYSGNIDFLSLRNCFHGLHFECMTMTGLASCHHAVPAVPGFLHVDNPDQYRGVSGTGIEPYLRSIDSVIASSTPGKIAGLIAEPIQGYGGVIPLPGGYLVGAFERVRKAGGVCIVDEIQTGFGRTGTNMWAFNNHGVVPDIVVVAKGIANGFPLAAVIAKRPIAEAMAKKKFFNTYGSNPVGCAAGRAVLRAIETDGTQEICRTVGGTLMKKLLKVKQERSLIGDVRGQGLMIGVEVVKDSASKEPAPEIAIRIVETAKNKGLIVGRGGTHGNVIRINPPMCITEADAEFIAEALHEGSAEN